MTLCAVAGVARHWQDEWAGGLCEDAGFVLEYTADFL